MDESNLVTVSEVHQQPPEAPLRVSHLLLVTACVAIVAGTRTAWTGVGSAALTTYDFVAHVTMAMVYGFALLGLALFITHRSQRRGHFPTAPGYYLLLVLAVIAMAEGLLAIGIKLAESTAWGSAPGAALWLWHARVLLLCLAALFGCTAFGLLMPANRCWKGSLLVPAVVLAAMLAGQVGYLTGGWTPPAKLLYVEQFVASASGGVLFAFGAALDWRRGVRRDWLHWAAVSVGLLAATASMLDALHKLELF